jgi:ribosomal protein S18 acetylase RimI-like enzyme
VEADGTTVEIVELTPDDWTVFRDVRLRALADAPAAFGSGLAAWADAPEERWRHRLEAVELNLVARSGDQHVGMASGSVDGDDAELISMWVDPAFRGRGVAAALTAAVVDWATANGRTTYLMVRSDNARAIAAYERAGFVDLGVPEGQDGPPENRMVHRPRDTRA